jgi:hypothetical protein
MNVVTNHISYICAACLKLLVELEFDRRWVQVGWLMVDCN